MTENKVNKNHFTAEGKLAESLLFLLSASHPFGFANRETTKERKRKIS